MSRLEERLRADETIHRWLTAGVIVFGLLAAGVSYWVRLTCPPGAAPVGRQCMVVVAPVSP